MKSTEYWPEWQQNRIDFMVGLCGEKFFENKTILELGAFNGYIGATFAHKYGAKVKCIEGRQYNCDNIKRDYPFVDVECHNLDTPEWDFGDYDIIINFGLIYHLHLYHYQHIQNCIRHSKTLFVETVTFDSVLNTCLWRQESPADADQSMSEYGAAPTRAYMEGAFDPMPCTYRMYKDSRLNAGPHVYDWEELNDGIQKNTYRRFWIVQNLIN